MAKKKKDKFHSMNEFRKNYSKRSLGHPDFVFGCSGDTYHSFGLTHTPKQEYHSVKLTQNPNPSDTRDSYLQTKVKHTPKKYFGSAKSDWGFHSDDRAYVRHKVKKYRKKNK
ncbi:MAG: hypothetical protein E7650_06695 [Ruminococcaceae bacterium]|nr:hypothetical protein [Oscillospiraceae bacterium]